MSYHPTPAALAAYDRDDAALRDLVTRAHTHRQAGGCDPVCPGGEVLLDILTRPAEELVCLLRAALVRIDDLQTGIGDAITAIAPARTGE